jgi:hypothetical protein
MKHISLAIFLALFAVDAAAQTSNFWEDGSLKFSATYYGRDRDTENDRNEIHVNTLGLGLDYVSGYSGGIVGFDLGANANLGRGRGQSEILDYDPRTDKDESFVAIRTAALKFRADMGGAVFHLRGGYTPISVGTLGSSGGLFNHSYRGAEAKLVYGNFQIGYGIADQFHNEWSKSFHDMTNAWHQNRYGNNDGKEIRYIHSLGLRWDFTEKGFLDMGAGQGKDYRDNAQVALSFPFSKELSFTGYAFWGKYKSELSGFANPEDEYHFSGMFSYKLKDLLLTAGYGYTWAPDSDEMNFRMTAWANSDNRNFIQTWAQLDDFVWHNESVVKLGADYPIGKLISVLPGLSAGLSYNEAWGLDGGDNAYARELNYNLRYAFDEGKLKGLSAGVHMGHLWTGGGFAGKQDRDDIKVIVAYSYLFK